ncbi:hypothetical protein ACFWC5_36900 [Streptomyces sp. NPDC060085]|uniref:hypothetical protein n=1 Tax=Streptomyces sp. NPDC060085 TaxID=3347054 RepID=UPI00364B802A
MFARGLSPLELAERLAATLLYEAEHVVVPVGEHTGASLLELVDDAYDIGLRLGTVNGWVYAVAYGGWPAEFGPLAPVSRDGAHVFLLEYEEENGKPVPPQFVYVHNDRLLAAFNMHLDGSWGYKKVEGDSATAARLQERLTAADLPHSKANKRDIHRAVLEMVGESFGLSLPREEVVSGILPAVLLDPA